MLKVSAPAQNAALTIVNNSSCAQHITMYARCTCLGAGGCTGLVSNAFTVPGGCTFSWTDPCNFESGTGYSAFCTSSSPIGFTTTVCGCYAPGAPGFVWNYAHIDFTLPCSCGIVGDLSAMPPCGSNPLTSSCTSTNSATWTQSSTAPYDIQIVILP
jgi:hypothetical protein